MNNLFQSLFKKLFSLSFIFILLPLSSQTIIKGSDRIVKVNKTVITRDELEKTYNEINKLAPIYGKSFSKKEVLQTMIDEVLLRNEIKTKGLIVDQNQVNQEINKIKYQYTQFMSQQNPNFQYSEEEFKAYLLKEGNITYEKFEEKIKEKVLVNQYIFKRAEAKLRAVDQKVFSDSELRKFRNDNLSQFVQPDSVEVKHIFLRTVLADGKTQIPANEKEIVRKRIVDILARLKKGESFDQLCELNSEDIESRDRINPKTGKLDRGYLGVMPVTGEYAEQLKEIYGFSQKHLEDLFNLGAGKYSDIIESRVGFHIFYIVNKIPERIIPYEEAKPQIIEYFKLREKEKIFVEEYQNLIKELREKAEITYYAEEFRDK